MKIYMDYDHIFLLFLEQYYSMYVLYDLYYEAHNQSCHDHGYGFHDLIFYHHHLKIYNEFK